MGISEEKMTGSHITKFHTHKDEQPVTTDLLSQENQDYDNEHDQQLMTCKHDTGQGHHNPSDPQSTTSVDYKLATRKDESFTSEAVKNGGVAEIMEDTLNMVEGFINDMVSETSHTDAPTVVKDNNEMIAVSKLEKGKPVIVYENNNGAMKLADTGLKSNNTLDAHIVEEKEEWFYKWADKYDVWNDYSYSYTPTKESESKSSHTFTGDNSIFKLTETKHNGNSKTIIVTEVPTSIKSDFYIGKRQS